jgi:hypothetical protein
VSGHPRTGGSQRVALASLVAIVACGPVQDPDEVPAAAVEASDDVADATDEGRSRPDGGEGRPDGGGGRPDAGDGRLDGGGGRPDAGRAPRAAAVGAPFPVPSPSEESLTGEDLRARIVAACEAAQPDPPPPGPCVEVTIVERFDPVRSPGSWITTDPAGGELAPHGGTVTVYVADAASGAGEVDPGAEPDTSGGVDASDEEDRSAGTDRSADGDDPPDGTVPAEEEGNGDGA